MFELMPYATRRTVMNPFSFFDSDFWGTAAGEIKTDITDTGDAFKLEADLPGFKKEDIKIGLENDRLTISAERKDEHEEKGKNGCIRRERSYGSFTRSFDVSGIDTAAISAAYTDGVLTLTLPKRPELVPENRQIAIKSRGYVKIPGIFCSRNFLSSEELENVRCVRIGLYLGHDLLDDAVLAYDEGGADDAHADLAVILFFLPDAVGLYGLALRVGEQDEGQGILFRKLSV